MLLVGEAPGNCKNSFSLSQIPIKTFTKHACFQSDCRGKHCHFTPSVCEVYVIAKYDTGWVGMKLSRQSACLAHVGPRFKPCRVAVHTAIPAGKGGGIRSWRWAWGKDFSMM